MRSAVLIGMALGLLSAAGPSTACAAVPENAPRSIWVADAGANAVYRCTSVKCKAVGSGWSAPSGMCADHWGDVFVADAGNSRIVELDSFGGQLGVYADPGQYPSGCATAYRDRTLAVTNAHGTSGGSGNIVFYAYGTTSPTKTVAGVDVAFDYCGFDKDGRLYDSGTDASGTVHIGVVAKNGSVNMDTGLTGLSAPGGVQIADYRGLLSISDPAANAIRQYTLPGLTYVGSLPYPGPAFAFVRYNPVIWTLDAADGQAVAYDLLNGKRIRTLKGFSNPDGIVALPIGEQ